MTTMEPGSPVKAQLSILGVAHTGGEIRPVQVHFCNFVNRDCSTPVKEVSLKGQKLAVDVVGAGFIMTNQVDHFLPF